MMGVGKIESLPGIGDAAPARVKVDLVQPTGGFAGDQFDPKQIELVDWGHLTLEFNHDSGRVIWSSKLDEYGNGEYEIERLARPMLADCESTAKEIFNTTKMSVIRVLWIYVTNSILNP